MICKYVVLYCSLVGSNSRIVGGEVALRREFPYLVYLTYNGHFSCGGSIIDPYLILTAAHCVYGKKAHHLFVTAGDLSLTGLRTNPKYLQTTGNGTRQTRITKYIYIHEEYYEQANYYDYKHDIALMVLGEPFVFRSSIQKIRLPEREDEDFTGYLTASGWGATLEEGSTSEILMKVRLPIVDNKKCTRAYKKVGSFVTGNMLCAGQAGHDACQGDSGGPGACEKGGDQILCGVISKGYGCGRAGYPGVFTRVANYINWLNTTLEKHKCVRYIVYSE